MAGRGRRLAAGAGAALLAASAVWGAEAASERPPERIVVTATRAPVDWLARADGAARFDAAAIERVGADHVEELLNRAPGTYLHRGSGAEHLTAIRSPVLTGGAGAGSFLYLEDGVPLRAAGFANVNGLFESVSELAGAVEVVRGPGSALYGSNAVHGLVNVVTPEPDGTSLVDISSSTLDRQRVVARIGVGDGFYVAALAAHEGGWRADSGVDQQKLIARWDGALGAWDARATFAFVNLNQETAGYVRGPDAYKDPALRRTNPNPEAFRDARAARAQARLERTLGDGATLAVTPYARWNAMDFLQHFLPGTPLEESGHASLGVLSALYSERENARYVFGADVEHTSGSLAETQEAASFGPFPQGVHYDYDVAADTAALYADAVFDLSAAWTLQAGARLEAARYDYDTAAAPGVGGRFLRPPDRVDDFTTLAPNVALLRRFGTTSIAYARYARGARAPQTTDLYRLQSGQTSGAADVETIDSVEVGWRGAEGPLTWDLAAFAMKKEHVFFRDADGFNVVDGATRHRGVEAEGRFALTPTLSLAAAATYARHTYAFDRPVSANVTESIASGDDVDTAPRRLANVRALWEPTSALELEAEWVHVGRYFMDASDTQVYPGHDLLNLRGAWRFRDGASAYVIVRNALDAAYAERADYAFGSERYFPGEERGFTLGVRAAF